MPLYICPTPIGNLEDITLRVLRILKESDVIFAEDTRRARILLSKYDIESKRLYSYNKDNWRKRIPLLESLLLEGKIVSLISDAGTPGISDMGVEAIRLCVDKDFKVEVLPGPTAFVPALLLSTFTPHPFLFYGFLPSQRGRRRKVLSSLKSLPFTLVFYEAPHRISESLCDILEVLGDRRGCLVREISKVHEEALRGKISELLERSKDLKGEMVLVIEGCLKEPEVKEDSLEDKILLLMKEGFSSKEIAQELHDKFGLSKKEVYKKVLELKGRGEF